MEREETLELIRSAQLGDRSACEELVTKNSPLIKSVIRRYKNKGVEYDDLYQLGCVGFIKAVRNLSLHDALPICAIFPRSTRCGFPLTPCR